MRIMIVEDEQRLADDICRALHAQGYVCEHTGDGEDAWFRGDTEDYAAIILDLGLPGLDGLSVLKRWREADVRTPVLILTARGSWNERVEGIDAGADDYLSKPFQIEELLARLRAIVRRSAGQATSMIRIGALLLDARQMRVSRDGVPLQLTPLEYRALAYLIHQRGQVVPQHTLSDHVYGVEADRGANTLEVLIGRLRRKVGPDVIETRRGYGYIVSGGSADADGAGRAG
ncbi:MAG: response regulator transcription factor [Hyphomicrobiaceae bacterium]